MLTKLSTAVYGPDGEITSIAELDEVGKIEFIKDDKFQGKDRPGLHISQL